MLFRSSRRPPTPTATPCVVCHPTSGLSGDLVHTVLPAWRAGMPRPRPHVLTERLWNEWARRAGWWTGLCRCRRVPSVGLGLRGEPTGLTHACLSTPASLLPRPRTLHGTLRGPPKPVLEPCPAASPPGLFMKDQESQVPEAGPWPRLCVGHGGVRTLCTGVLLSKPPWPVSEGP